MFENAYGQFRADNSAIVGYHAGYLLVNIGCGRIRCIHLQSLIGVIGGMKTKSGNAEIALCCSNVFAAKVIAWLHIAVSCLGITLALFQIIVAQSWDIEAMNEDSWLAYAFPPSIWAMLIGSVVFEVVLILNSVFLLFGLRNERATFVLVYVIVQSVLVVAATAGSVYFLFKLKLQITVGSWILIVFGLLVHVSVGKSWKSEFIVFPDLVYHNCCVCQKRSTRVGCGGGCDNEKRESRSGG